MEAIEVKAAFVVVFAKNPKHGESGYEIGLAHQGVPGYTPGYGTFDDPNITYEEACKFVDDLNMEHYGHSKLDAAKIVLSSMFHEN